MSDIQTLLDMVRAAGAAGFLCFLRIGAAMALLPAFGERSLPARVRLALGLAFTAVVAPAAASDLLAAAVRPGAFPALWLTEPLIGLMLGLSLRLTVMALQMAGTIAAQSASLSQVFASAGSEPVPVAGELLVLGGLTLALTLGLHVELAETLAESYRDLPPGSLPAAGEALAWALPRIGASFALAVSLAMPFVIAALIYNVALGVINRAMPQLMVAMIGAPALTAGGLILLMLAAPAILSAWVRHLGGVLQMPF